MAASGGDAKKQRTRWLIYAAAPVLLVTVLVNMPPFMPCMSNPSASDGEYWFPANEIVVQPWQGLHHVYGIFSVPEQYRRHRLYKAKLVIQGIIEDLSETSPEAGADHGSQVDPGHYAMRVHLPTRMALWLLLTGRFGDLKSACRWWLVITDR